MTGRFPRVYSDHVPTGFTQLSRAMLHVQCCEQVCGNLINKTRQRKETAFSKLRMRE